MHDPLDDAVRDFLGDSPPARELREMREALEERLRRLRSEASADPAARDALRPRIEQVESQIRVLAEEEAISGFVEETVRSTAMDMGITAPEPEPETENAPAIPAWADMDLDDVPEE